MSKCYQFLVRCICVSKKRCKTFYRSHCGKTMFSQVSVCPEEGGVTPWTHRPSGQTHPHQILQDTINERTVRILLECILVCWINAFSFELVPKLDEIIFFLSFYIVKKICQVNMSKSFPPPFVGEVGGQEGMRSDSKNNRQIDLPDLPADPFTVQPISVTNSTINRK